MNSQLLWYTSRASGAVSLVLFTAVMVLGLAARLRVEGRGWPRFLSVALHRNLALMSLAFLTLHIVTAVTDPFTSLGLTPVLVPFGSSYRTVWLGLGTVAVELMVAVTVTSLVRSFIGARVWRLIHWSAYASWPVAVAHGLGTGTDGGTLWLRGLSILCIGAVGGVGLWRIGAAPADPLGATKRAAVGASRVARP